MVVVVVKQSGNFANPSLGQLRWNKCLLEIVNFRATGW